MGHQVSLLVTTARSWMPAGAYTARERGWPLAGAGAAIPADRMGPHSCRSDGAGGQCSQNCSAGRKVYGRHNI